MNLVRCNCLLKCRVCRGVVKIRGFNETFDEAMVVVNAQFIALCTRGIVSMNSWKYI